MIWLIPGHHSKIRRFLSEGLSARRVALEGGAAHDGARFPANGAAAGNRAPCPLSSPVLCRLLPFPRRRLGRQQRFWETAWEGCGAPAGRSVPTPAVQCETVSAPLDQNSCPVVAFQLRSPCTLSSL